MYVIGTDFFGDSGIRRSVGGTGKVEKRTIDEVLKEHTGSLMSIPGVVGTAEGERAGKPCIRVLVVRKTPQLTKNIPSAIEGYVVTVQETGRIRALNTEKH